MRGAARPALVAALVAVPALLHAQDARPPEPPPAEDDGGYGATPGALVPFRGAGAPARRFFVTAPEFRGPGRDDPPPADLDAVRIGLLAPLRGPDVRAGKAMQEATRMAFEEANAAGGFGPSHLPFELLVRDETGTWGAAGEAAVELTFDRGAWGILGGYEDANSHVLSRVLLKLEVPNLNATGVDPTLTEHNIPWLVRVRPDDRQTSYRLAQKVFEEDARTRVVLFRANSRYGRTGTGEFKDAARRLHHPILLETRYEPGDTPESPEFAARVARIRDLAPDAVVLWGRPGPTAVAVKALRAAGVTCALYGPDRVAAPEFLESAGDAAEGFVFTYPMDPRPGRAAWDAFRARWRERCGDEPDATAAFSYDAARMLVDAVREAGLNRARIRDVLFARRTYEGVAGTIRLDVTGNDTVRPVLGRVAGGRFVFE